jgi:hypothetical protein
MVEYGGYPLGEGVDVVIDVLGGAEGERGKGFAGNFGVE